METTRRRIRKDFAPLNVAVSVVCPTTGSPLTQVYSAVNGTYEPNREITATILRPIVVLNATDGSLDVPYGNAKLGEVHWFANGKDISTLPDWNGKYAIRTDGSMNGSLMVSRNVAVNERITVHMEASVYDGRLGINIPIKTDGIVLSTTDKSEDMYSLALECSAAHQYNPFNDRLFRYEYKVSHGLQEASDEEEAEATDENSYKFRVPVKLYRGAAQVDFGKYTLHLYRKNGTGPKEQLNVGAADEAIDVTPSQILLDLRLIEDCSYTIEAEVGGETVAGTQISIAREHPVFRIEPSNISNFPPAAEQHYDEAAVSSNGHAVECASSIIYMVWNTVTARLPTPKRHNEGQKTLFSLSEAGVGNTFESGWIEIFIEAEQKRAYSIAADEDGNVLVDEEGNTLIFN